MGKEINRILKQFAELQHGDHWTDNSFKEVLHGVNAEQAMKRIDDKTNSMWMLVAHIIYWRTSVVNRLGGSLDTPAFPDFDLPDEPNEANWRQALQDFESTYHLLRNAISHFNEDNLDKPSPRKEQTYYELMIGCLQHDNYHLGQMMLLKKACG